ncbi:uncharacterized protein LOC123271913 [Cotesia glomerata]|nr:uncharacterized protein LOC123271913 [Cotesia glomerata]
MNRILENKRKYKKKKISVSTPNAMKTTINTSNKFHSVSSEKKQNESNVKPHTITSQHNQDLSNAKPHTITYQDNQVELSTRNQSINLHNKNPQTLESPIASTTNFSWNQYEVPQISNQSAGDKNWANTPIQYASPISDGQSLPYYNKHYDYLSDTLNTMPIFPVDLSGGSIYDSNEYPHVNRV